MIRKRRYIFVYKHSPVLAHPADGQNLPPCIEAAERGGTARDVAAFNVLERAAAYLRLLLPLCLAFRRPPHCSAEPMSDLIRVSQAARARKKPDASCGLSGARKSSRLH